MGCPCDKILQVAEYWGMAGCSPGQSSLAAVLAGFCHIYAFVIYLLSFTPCALNGLPHHGIQVRSQKSKVAHYVVNFPFDRWLRGPLGAAVFQQQWDDMLGMACRYRPRGEGEMAVRGAGNRETLTPVFFNFSTGSRRSIFERQLKFILVPQTWSHRCVEHYWKLGGFAANLPPERWISRVLAWNPLGRRRSGCPRTSWPNKFISYIRYRHLAGIGS